MRLLIGTEGGLHHPDGTALPGHRISALAVGEGTWVLVDGRQLWRGSEVGWTTVGELDEAGRCLLPTPDGLLVGTAGAHLLRLHDDRWSPLPGFERVEGRAEWYTPWGGPPDTRSLSRGPDGTLYANVHVGGILRSRDGGRSWEPTIDIHADVHQVLAHPTRASTVLAATARGLAVSRDGGGTWTFRTEGLHHPYARAVAVAGETILLSASSGPSGGRAALYRTGMGGNGPFQRCEGGLPEWFEGNIDTHRLVAGDGVAALGTTDGRLYRSEDLGSTWETVGTDLPPITCLAPAP